MSLCSECIDNIDASYDTANSYIEWMPDWVSYWDTATTWNSTTAHNMSMLVQQLYWILDSLCRGEAGASFPYSVPYYLRNCIGDGAISMDDILTAIYESDKLRWFHFINYIDAMRAGIWNTEIYETHLADWYRHFSI